MDSKTISDAQLEEMLEEEIACQGTYHRPVCPGGRSAVVKQLKGCCCGRSPKNHTFKCLDCYLFWRDRVVRSLQSNGYIRCSLCKRHYSSIEDFATYVSI